MQTVLLMRSQKNSRKAIFHDKAKYPGLEDYKTTLSGVFMEWIDEVFKSLKHKTFEDCQLEYDEFNLILLLPEFHAFKPGTSHHPN